MSSAGVNPDHLPAGCRRSNNSEDIAERKHAQPAVVVDHDRDGLPDKYGQLVRPAPVARYVTRSSADIFAWEIAALLFQTENAISPGVAP